MRLYGSPALLYLKYKACTEKNRLVESGYITKIDLRSTEGEDTVECRVTITYSTRGQSRKLVRNDVVIEPGRSVPFFIDAEGVESLTADIISVRYIPYHD